MPNINEVVRDTLIASRTKSGAIKVTVAPIDAKPPTEEEILYMIGQLKQTEAKNPEARWSISRRRQNA